MYCARLTSNNFFPNFASVKILVILNMYDVMRFYCETNVNHHLKTCVVYSKNILISVFFVKSKD